MKYLLLTGFLLYGLTLSAQFRGYSQGYVVLHDGDTLEGFVKDRSIGVFSDLYQKVKFKRTRRSFRKKYRADHLLGYGYNGMIFESISLREETAFFKFRYYVDPRARRVFLKLILRNEGLSYYHLEFIQDDNNFIDFVPLFYKPGSPEMVRVTQGVFGLKRERLAEYFRECPRMARALEEKELRSILDVYQFYLDRCSR